VDAHREQGEQKKRHEQSVEDRGEPWRVGGDKALSGQLADARDKARLIRIGKACEIAIMIAGAIGLLMAWML